MKELTDLERAVLVDGLDDWVGLWMIAREVREREPGLSDAQVRTAVIEVVSALHKGGYVRVGHPDANGRFHHWEMPPDEAASRINEEWRALGRDPGLGEIGWLDNTQRGDEVASESS